MASEKVMYWTALAVLGFGVANGVLNDRAEWMTRLADHSIAMIEQASDTAAHYPTLANGNLMNNGPGRTQIAMLRAQERLAYVQRSLARHHAEMDRAQADRIRARVVCPRQNFAIDIPQPPAHNMF